MAGLSGVYNAGQSHSGMLAVAGGGLKGQSYGPQSNIQKQMMISGQSSNGSGSNKDYNMKNTFVNKYPKHLQKIDSKLFNQKNGN